MRRLLSVAPVLLWLVTPLAFAQLPGITSQPLPGGGQSWSLPVQTLVFITLSAIFFADKKIFVI